MGKDHGIVKPIWNLIKILLRRGCITAIAVHLLFIYNRQGYDTFKALLGHYFQSDRFHVMV